MKSNIINLKKRGYMTNNDINQFSNYSNEKLYELVNSKVAVERTVAIHLLSERIGVSDELFVKFLLEKLLKEKKLYTKIEICNALEKGDVNTAREMIKYLGCIGKNQHKTLPERVSMKSSYPLARDIIARTLSNMTVEILPVLIEVLYSNDETKISEVIDAIGYLVFYNPNYSNELAFEAIIDVMERYDHNDVIYWKCVICLSAFKTKACVEILENILESDKKDVIKLEAKRSLNLIGSVKI